MTDGPRPYQSRAAATTEPVDAVQLTQANGPAVWEWAESKPYVEPDGSISGLTIFTPDGRRKAEFGDWVIRDGDAFYPMADDRFRARYEAVDVGDAEAVTR